MGSGSPAVDVGERETTSSQKGQDVKGGPITCTRERVMQMVMAMMQIDREALHCVHIFGFGCMSRMISVVQ